MKLRNEVGLELPDTASDQLRECSFKAPGARSLNMWIFHDDYRRHAGLTQPFRAKPRSYLHSHSDDTSDMLKRIRDRIVIRLVSLLDHLLDDSVAGPDSYLRLAKIKYKQKDYRGAIADLNETLRHDPANSDALHWRCRAKYDDGQTVPALHDALRAIGLRSDDSLAHYMLGNIYLKLENYLAAEKAYSTVLKFANTDAAAYAGRGYANYGMQRYAESLNDLHAAKTRGFDAELLDEYIEVAQKNLKSVE